MFKWRVHILMGLFGAAFLVVAGRLAQLQIWRGEQYRELVLRGRANERMLPALRGSITDRYGEVLAEDVPSYDLAVRVDRLRLAQVRPEEVAEARRTCSDPKNKTLLDPERLKQEFAALQARLEEEEWVKGLSALTKLPSAELAEGLLRALDQTGRGWAGAATAQPIARNLDPEVWLRLRSRQEDVFHNPPPAKPRPARAILARIETPAPPSLEENAGLPGLVCTVSVRRVYPRGSLAAHALGTLGELQPAQVQQLRREGELQEHREERQALWERKRGELTAAQAEGLAELLQRDPKEIISEPELLECLRNLDGEGRRRAAQLGIEDPVRWASRPSRMALCEAERVALGLGEEPSWRSHNLVDLRVGETGIEGWYNELLRGKHGFLFSWKLTGPEAEEARVRPDAQPRPGDGLRLTLSSVWQRACETTLASQERPAAMVVLDCRNGEVLALASFPTFDPNLFSPPRRSGGERLRAYFQDASKPLLNRCIQAEYPLGSVMKVLIAAVGLEREAIHPEDCVNCTSSLQLGRTVFRCDGNRAHGTVNVNSALCRSCNVFFYKQMEKIGVEALAPYAFAVGLGRRTALDLPGERPGIYPDRAWRLRAFQNPQDQGWSLGKDYHLAIGQGYMNVTPLQAASLMACVANGGRAVTPRLRLDSPAEAPRPVGFSEKTLQAVRKGLEDCVNNGTPGARGTAFSAFHVHGEPLAIQVAGKTGTADVGPGAEDRRPHAWFAGYAPAAKPEIAFAVLLEHGGHGGETAAPLAHKVLRQVYGTASQPHPHPGRPKPEAETETAKTARQ